MAKSTNPFRYFDSSPEVIRLVVIMYVRYPLSLRRRRSYEAGASVVRSGRQVRRRARPDPGDGATSRRGRRCRPASGPSWPAPVRRRGHMRSHSWPCRRSNHPQRRLRPARRRRKSKAVQRLNRSSCAAGRRRRPQPAVVHGRRSGVARANTGRIIQMVEARAFRRSDLTAFGTDEMSLPGSRPRIASGAK